MVYLDLDPVRRAAVIGSGVMGAAIAAHLANAGIEVLLYDLPSDAPGTPRNQIAADAVARLPSTRPPPLMDADAASAITPLNLEDDLPRLAECDWIIEAVTEDLDVKRGIYERIAPHRRAGSIISSNTRSSSSSVMVDWDSSSSSAGQPNSS